MMFSQKRIQILNPLHYLHIQKRTYTNNFFQTLRNERQLKETSSLIDADVRDDDEESDEEENERGRHLKNARSRRDELLRHE